MPCVMNMKQSSSTIKRDNGKQKQKKTKKKIKQKVKTRTNTNCRKDDPEPNASIEETSLEPVP